jgi:hypothetical protein
MIRYFKNAGSQQEDSDLKSQIAVANKVYNQGKDYLDLLKEIGGESIGSNVKVIK